MNEEKLNAKKLKIAYIGGGSHNWARILMNDFAQDKEIGGEVRLYDIDLSAAKANEKIGNNIITGGNWVYKATETLEEALRESDFVFISILPGTFEEMRIDVHTPEKYGIYQSVGDTVGFGGTIRAWRTVPMIAEIGEAVKKYTPDAWVINFTNPMSVCVKTLYEVFPKIKAYGCCHEVFDTQKILRTAIEKIKGIENIDFKDIKTNVLGINHFTWIDRASYKNIDIMPIYKKFVDKYYEEGFNETGENWFNNHFKSSERVKFDLFKKYGHIAAAGDRHLAEFVPNSWYLQKNSEWKFGLTPVQWRIDNREKLIKETEQLISGELKYKFKESGEDFVRQIKAICGLGDLVTNVNLPNSGQVQNLNNEVVVETNALFCANGVFPVISGNIDSEILELVKPHAENQKLIVDAGLKKDKNMLFKAFINDPQAKGISEKNLKNLFEEMMQNR